MGRFGEIWGEMGRCSGAAGHGCASVAHRMKRGGAGHMRSVSAITFCTSGMRLMSSTVA